MTNPKIITVAIAICCAALFAVAIVGLPPARSADSMVFTAGMKAGRDIAGWLRP